MESHKVAKWIFLADCKYAEELWTSPVMHVTPLTNKRDTFNSLSKKI